MSINSEDIKRVADLARLDLSAEEMEKYGGQLESVLSYIDQLKEADTEGVEPTAQITGLINRLRADEIGDCPADERAAALSQAPGSDNGQIKVRKVFN